MKLPFLAGAGGTHGRPEPANQPARSPPLPPSVDRRPLQAPAKLKTFSTPLPLSLPPSLRRPLLCPNSTLQSPSPKWLTSMCARPPSLPPPLAPLKSVGVRLSVGEATLRVIRRCRRRRRPGTDADARAHTRLLVLQRRQSSSRAPPPDFPTPPPDGQRVLVQSVPRRRRRRRRRGASLSPTSCSLSEGGIGRGGGSSSSGNGTAAKNRDLKAKRPQKVSSRGPPDAGRGRRPRGRLLGAGEPRGVGARAPDLRRPESLVAPLLCV